MYNGYNISMHANTSYQYSEAIVNIETEIKVLKQRKVTLQIAKQKSNTRYIKSIRITGKKIKRVIYV
ncbi:hypothetical protein OFR75_00340 [Brachyspira hyodysenteriae]|nr:hypothetical protein [Brachyspira hyodysenteriae]